MTEKTEYTLEGWREEAIRRFGPDKKNWTFVCSGCGHVQSVGDFLKLQPVVTADVSQAAYQECIGRYTGGKIWAEMKKGEVGPCNYAAFGLFYGPISVTMPDGKVVHVFDFAEAPQRKDLCKHTGLERLPSGNGLTLSSCCHEGADDNLHAICEIENQCKCVDYEV